jgi:hypothetical protein
VKVDSLQELKAAFAQWRREKKYPREAMPRALVERARRTASVHGVGRVARAVRIDSRHLRESPRGTERNAAAEVPSYSRVALVAPAPAAHPFAELEMPSGLKLRLFSQTPDALGLLASLCGAGGER